MPNYFPEIDPATGEFLSPLVTDAIDARAAAAGSVGHNHDDHYYTEAEADGRFVQGSDPRLTDARTPTGHSHPISGVTGLQAALDGKQSAGSYATAGHTHTAAAVTDLTETVQDIVGALLVAGVNTTITYDDTAGTVTINSTASGGGGETDPEIVRDVIGGALVAGAGIQITVNDAADTITVTSTAVQPTRAITAGTGLTGGGDLSANRSIAVDFGQVATAAQGAKADSAVQPAGLPTWTTIGGKPAVVADGADAAEARGKIGAVDQAAIDTAITGLINGAPGALDTLNELSAAMGGDANFAATTATALGNRLRVDADQGLDGTRQAQARANMGLGAVTATGADAAAARAAVGAGSKTAVDLREFGTITDGASHTALLSTANTQLSHGDTLVIPPGVTVNSGALTFTKAIGIKFRHGSKLNLTDMITVTIPSGAGAFRLIDPNLVADAAMGSNKIMIDMTAGDELEWRRGTVKDARRVLRTLDVPIVTLDRPVIRQLNNPDPLVTGTLIQIRNAWSRVQFLKPHLIMPDTSGTVTNSQSGIAVNGGKNVLFDDPTVEGGYSAVVIRESSTVATDLSSNVKFLGGTFKGQRASNGPAQGIYVQKTSGLSIIGCHVVDFGGTGIAVAYEWSDDITVMGNVLRTSVPANTAGGAESFGMLISKARGGIVAGNKVSGNTKFAFQVSDSEDINTTANDSKTTWAGGASRAYLMSGMTRGRFEGNTGTGPDTVLRISGAMTDTLVGENDLNGTVPMDTSTMTGTLRLADAGPGQPPVNTLVTVGSTRRNTAPAVGGSPGWIYTTSGWKKMAPAPASGSVGWNPPNLTAGTTASTTVTVTGAALGDHAQASLTTAVPAGVILFASVTAADTVTVTLANFSGAAFDHPGGSLQVVVTKP